MSRVLVLASKTSYRAEEFHAAAGRLGVELRLGLDRCHVLAEQIPAESFPGEWAGSLALDFRDRAAAAAAIAQAGPWDAIVPTDETTAVIAALSARGLGLPHNAPEAAYATRNKRVMRERLREAGVPSPRFVALPLATDPNKVPLGLASDPAPPSPEAARRSPIRFPVVVKPLLLSSSRGVIRADDRASFVAAWLRLRKLLSRPELRGADDDPARRQLLVEEFVPGVEVAVEGILDRGRLHVLARFDKPDPLDGPFFEETIYVTPSRLPASAQAALDETTQRAAAALGLTSGPVHAELRWNEQGPQVIEVAARSIGGLCARTLRFSLGSDLRTLEELVLAHALGRGGELPPREERAAGVMMIPIPRAGVLLAVSGLDDARRVPGIEDAVISTRIGELLVPLPEGASYLGFLFARGGSPAEVEAALRQAHATLRFTVAKTL